MQEDWHQFSASLGYQNEIWIAQNLKVMTSITTGVQDPVSAKLRCRGFTTLKACRLSEKTTKVRL